MSKKRKLTIPSNEEDARIYAGIAEDADAYDTAPDAFAVMRPAAEVVPHIVAAYKKGRGVQKTPKKVQTTLRLSPEVIEYFKSQGPGWQRKIDEALKEWARHHGKAA